MTNIKESDWKYLSRLKSIMLERLCGRILSEIHCETAPEKAISSCHQQVLSVNNHVRRLNEIIRECFVDWRRSRSIIILLQLIRNQAITDSEIKGFSEETRERVKNLTETFE